MILLNTCPEQKFTGDFPGVTIINCDTRPSSLGAARNLAISHAKDGILITADDDDLYHSNHTSNYLRHFEDGIDWVWLDRQFVAEKFTIQKFYQGQMPCFAFTKKAWEAVKYSELLTVGEDRQFIGQVAAKFKGVKTNLADEEVSYIYSWNNQVHHVSGLGDDKPGQQKAHDRIAEDLKARFIAGTEQRGEIRLQPTMTHNPDKMISEFLSQRAAGSPKKDVCIVQLGRYGDLANILPICKHIAEQYATPYLMVSREFASILDGVSYVKPEIVDLDYSRLQAALGLANKKFQLVIRAQIYGRHWEQNHTTESYSIEMWKDSGFIHKFYDKSFKLIFDKRSATRENALYEKLKSDRPLLLVQTTAAVSSPFPFGVKLLAMIREQCQQFNIVDLASLKCERIYDTIGLMDRAAGLVTCDSAMAHISAASKVKTLAITNPVPWAGSSLRCNCVFKKNYTEVELNPSEIISAINALTL
jgi:glycosyltransferase involved in cell wall biosynthesis